MVKFGFLVTINSFCLKVGDMENCLIIGDIAGQYSSLKRLLKKCPDYLPISIGDMVDRGPDSKKVLDFFMKNGKALLGNHEHMMLDYNTYRNYDYGIWVECNGGDSTLRSFQKKERKVKVSEKENENENEKEDYFLKKQLSIPKKYLDWLSSLPLFMDLGDVLVTHAPKHPLYTLEECCEFVSLSYRTTYWSGRVDCSVIWNRSDPEPIPDKYQIFGHNGVHYFITDEDKKDFAVCIDASRQGKLIAMILPSKEIVSVDI